MEVPRPLASILQGKSHKFDKTKLIRSKEEKAGILGMDAGALEKKLTFNKTTHDKLLDQFTSGNIVGMSVFEAESPNRSIIQFISRDKKKFPGFEIEVADTDLPGIQNFMTVNKMGGRDNIKKNTELSPEDLSMQVRQEMSEASRERGTENKFIMEMNVTRRKFIKGTASVAASATVPLGAVPAGKVVASVAPEASYSVAERTNLLVRELLSTLDTEETLLNIEGEITPYIPMDEHLDPKKVLQVLKGKQTVREKIVQVEMETTAREAAARIDERLGNKSRAEVIEVIRREAYLRDKAWEDQARANWQATRDLGDY